MKQFSLAQYVAMSSAFLLGAKTVDANIIYTDINPDIVLNEDDEYYVFDLDSNGVNEFYMLKESFTFIDYTTYGSPAGLHTRVALWMVVLTTAENAIAGNNRFFSEPYGGSFYLYYPFPLDQFSLISEHNNFQNAEFQNIAFKTFVTGDLQRTGGNWFPEKIDQFFGIKFQGDDNHIHYGWIRCSVLDSAETLIIKDYAYEAEADSAITAGAITSDVDTTDSNIVEIYSSENTIYISIQDTVSTGTIAIYNLSGKIIYNENITSTFEQIKLENATGVYFVIVQLEGARFIQKVLVN